MCGWGVTSGGEGLCVWGGEVTSGGEGLYVCVCMGD